MLPAVSAAVVGGLPCWPCFLAHMHVPVASALQTVGIWTCCCTGALCPPPSLPAVVLCQRKTAVCLYACVSCMTDQPPCVCACRYAPVAAPPALPVIPEAMHEDGPSPEPAVAVASGTAAAAAADRSTQLTGMLAAARRWLGSGSRAAGDTGVCSSSSLREGMCPGSSCGIRGGPGGFDPHCSV